MTWKLELAGLAAAAAAFSGWVALADPMAPPPVEEPVDHFPLGDYNAFDRDFRHAGSDCEVGLREFDLCFEASPHEAALAPGAPLPDNVLGLSAELRVLLATQLKDETLKTVRVGRSLALIDPETRDVRDVLRLDARTYANARGSSV